METFTLVDNLFINEYLPYLDEKQIKIYLYGLYMCAVPRDGDTVETLCAVLDVTEDELISTYTFFEDSGLVQIISKQPLEVKYLSLKKANQPPKKYKADRWTEFNAHLQALFPERMLTPNEYNEYYSFIDSSKIDEEAMLMIVQYCINLKGESVRYPYILTVARNWLADGVKTVADVEKKLEEYEAQSDEMRQVLLALGRKGGADLEEKQMLLKWKRSWGFELGAVLTAARSLKGGKTFKKLDARLDQFYRMNLYSAEEMDDYNAYRERLTGLTIEINKTLGVFYESLEHEIEVYTVPWVTKGYSDDALKTVAHYCFVSGIRTLEGMNGVIGRFFAQGILTVESVNEFISAGIEQDKLIKRIIERTGRSRNVTAGDREYYRTWTLGWGFQEDVLLYAAECSTAKTYPIPYMNQLLSAWKSAGVSTLDEAKKSTVTPVGSEGKTHEKTFEERDYSANELQAVLGDINNFEEIDV